MERHATSSDRRSLPVQVLRKTRAPASTPEDVSDPAASDLTTAGGEVWRCAQCQHLIAEAGDASRMAGRFRHHKTNPAGVRFAIAIFARAPGCRVSGPPTSLYSWFPPYLWRYAHCGRCQAHLGWYFQDTDRKDFFSLILPRIFIALNQ